MRPGTVGLLAVASLSLVVLLVVEPCRVAGQTKDKKKRDADIARYVKVMNDQFNSWDLNMDGVLDKDELAKAFRGNNAKAYDYQDPPPKPGPRVTMVALMTVPRVDLPFNAALADLVTRYDAKKAEKPAPLPPDVYQGYPDYQFIVLAGTKGQDRVTRQDFETWARNYAKVFENRHQAEVALKSARDKLATAKTAQGKKNAELEVLKHQQELVDAQAQLDLIPVAIQKAMNLKYP
jgi:hypothetical protein